MYDNLNEDEYRNLLVDEEEEVSKPLKKKKGPKQISSKNLSEEDIIHLAIKDFYNKDFISLVNLLTPFVEDMRNHILALKLLAYGLIETGYAEDAERYINRALSFNRNDIELLNFASYIEMIKGNVDNAISNLLDALELNNKNNKLISNLDYLKNKQDIQLLIKMIKPSEFLFLTLPQIPMNLIIKDNLIKIFKSSYFKVIIVLIVGFFVIKLVWNQYPSWINTLENFRLKRGIGKIKIKHVSIKDIDELLSKRNDMKVKLTEEEIQRKFLLLRSYIENRKHNKALILINEFKQSNASEKIQEHIEIMKGFLPDVDMQSLDFIPTYQDVIKAPYLYKGVYIRWNGTIANLEHKKRKETVFDLLINFIDDAVVEGISQAHFEGFVHIMNGEKIALFGKINGVTIDNKIIIEGKQMLRIGKK